VDHVEVTLTVVVLHLKDEDAEQSLQDIADQVADEVTEVLRDGEISANITPVKAVDCTTGIEEAFESP
jgi:hypothetical protein